MIKLASCTFIALLCFLAHGGSFAQVWPAHRCDGCSTTSQMEAIAIQHEFGTHFVYSMPNQLIRGFEVHRQCIGEIPRGEDALGRSDRSAEETTFLPCELGYQYTVFQVDVGPELSGFFSDMVSAWQEYGNSFHAYLNLSADSDLTSVGSGIPRSGANDAYRFMNDATYRGSILNQMNSILDGMQSPHTVRRLLEDNVVFSNFGISFGLQSQASLRARIAFEDGSAVTTQVVNGAVQYLPGSAYDANGTVIPDYSHNPALPGGHPGPLYGGHNPSSVEDWLLAAQNAGIPIVHGGGSGGGYIISCTYVDGSLISCRVDPY